MANIMNMVNLKNNVHRSGFDLSRRNCFTATVGEILPVMCEEVLPGDKWRINMREFMRTAPVQTATFGRVRQYYDFYFVPYNLLWDKWESWIMQTKNAFHAKSVSASVDEFPTHPYFSMNMVLSLLTNMQDQDSKYYLDYNLASRPEGSHLVYDSTTKLLQYLGYPVTKSTGITGDLALNPFPLLAYQKIYQDYFRFSQWEDAAPWTYNLDYILNKSDLEINISSLSSGTVTKQPSMFTLRYCNLDKDYFNGLLPSPQYGDTAMAGPISLDLSNVQRLNLSNDQGSYKREGRAFLPFGYQSVDGQEGKNYESRMVVNGTANSVGGSWIESANILLRSGDPFALSGESSMGLSILLLRQAEALQKWKEITLSGDLDYKTQLQKHWNVNVSDDNSYMCRYLGGIANNIDVSEVINTNLVDSSSEAEIHGKGVSASNGNINFTSHQYGVIMCVYHCKPIIEWNADNVLPRMLTKTKATDYAIPEFDQIGMESVLRGQFIYNAAQNWSQPIGYAPRYIDYKTSFDRINGEFQDTLKPWVIPHTITATDGNAITYKTFKVAPNILDNMFGVNASEADQFRCTAYFQVSAVRNLDRDGLPY
jgi:hypothetical protein